MMHLSKEHILTMILFCLVDRTTVVHIIPFLQIYLVAFCGRLELLLSVSLQFLVYNTKRKDWLFPMKQKVICLRGT